MIQMGKDEWMMHTKFRCLLVLMLVLCLVLSLAACGSNTEAAGTVPQESFVSELPHAAQKQTSNHSRKCPDNVLMTVDWKNGITLVGGMLDRSQVTSITFLDTLSTMPDSAWDVSEERNGSVMAWLENGTDLFIAGEGGVTANADSSDLFSGYMRAESIRFNDCFYTDNVTSMKEMFIGCWELTDLDVSFFRTSTVKNMYGMFRECKSLKELDVSSFDTSAVKDMGQMFFECSCLTALDVSMFDTSNVRNFQDMFELCESLILLDLSTFDTSKAYGNGLSGMFFGCTALAEVDVSSFDTSGVSSLQCMFQGCESLTALDLSGFDTSNICYWNQMFRDCTNLEMLDLSGFDFSNSVAMDEMFYACEKLGGIGCTIPIPEGCSTNKMYANSGLE